MTRVRIAVVPAAGLGTRMLPATRAVPKELLPVGGRPAIQWVIDEAIEAGIERVVVVSSPDKPAIGAYFAGHDETECEFEVVHQLHPAGLGDAVRVARSAVGSNAFAVLLPDEVILGGSRLLAVMLDDYERSNRSGVSLLRVEREEISSYGCAEIGERLQSEQHMRVTACVEKPEASVAPSCFALMGRYVLGPEVLDALDDTKPGVRGEIQLTDALDRVAGHIGLRGFEVLPSDSRVDVGNWQGWLDANNRVLSGALGTELAAS